MAQNADIVRQLFAAFTRRDATKLLSLADPAIVFAPATGRLAGREEPYLGHDGLLDYLADVARLWQELRSEPDEYLELEDGVVLCTGRVYAWGVGRVIDAPAGWLFRVRDGRITEGRVYETRRAAYQAAGLEWPPPAGDAGQPSVA
jgi:ketosteroid isomerase-like protein